MGFTSVEEIETRAKAEDCQLWEAILHDDMTERQVDRLESIGKMSSMYLAMKEANESYDKDLRSRSGLSGGDGEKMMEEVRKMQNLTGEFVGTVMANALKMGESNACMKRIVAAPTAGACGVLPGSTDHIRAVSQDSRSKDVRRNVHCSRSRTSYSRTRLHRRSTRGMSGRDWISFLHGSGSDHLYPRRECKTGL